MIGDPSSYITSAFLLTGDGDSQNMSVTRFKPQNAQCRRMYSCIQAAVSKLEDASKDRSTQRVSILTKLVPREPPLKLGMLSYCNCWLTDCC